jgi:hypothetical protein
MIERLKEAHFRDGDCYTTPDGIAAHVVRDLVREQRALLGGSQRAKENGRHTDLARPGVHGEAEIARFKLAGGLINPLHN